GAVTPSKWTAGGPAGHGQRRRPAHLHGANRAPCGGGGRGGADGWRGAGRRAPGASFRRSGHPAGGGSIELTMSTHARARGAAATPREATPTDVGCRHEDKKRAH